MSLRTMFGAIILVPTHGSPLFLALAVCWRSNPAGAAHTLSAFLLLCCCSGQIRYAPINLDRLQRWVLDGRLDTSAVITMKDLRDSGAIGAKVEHGVKLLANVSPVSQPVPPTECDGLLCAPDDCCRLQHAAPQYVDADPNPGWCTLVIMRS